jgi:hypothetical protein
LVYCFEKNLAILNEIGAAQRITGRDVTHSFPAPKVSKVLVHETGDSAHFFPGRNGSVINREKNAICLLTRRFVSANRATSITFKIVRRTR